MLVQRGGYCWYRRLCETAVQTTLRERQKIKTSQDVPRRPIRTTETAPRVTFEEEKVVVCGWESRETEGLQILNAHTGDPILIVGTRSLDDYYPCCTMEYTPENLYANVKRQKG